MATDPTVVLQREGAVALLTLNRPAQRNALSRQMAQALCEALENLRQDPSVRALVLQGAGTAFCAGGDMGNTHRAGPRSVDSIESGYELFAQLTRQLYEWDRPVIGAAQGVAFGAGFSLLLLCDMVLLAEDARLCMAFQRVGLVPDCGAMYTLPRWVGMQRAKELMFSAREIRAPEALALGLALEVLPSEQLLTRALALAQRFSTASPSALRMSKRALNRSFELALNDMLALEGAAQAVALASPYVAESAARFVSKQPPHFLWP